MSKYNGIYLETDTAKVHIPFGGVYVEQERYKVYSSFVGVEINRLYTLKVRVFDLDTQTQIISNFNLVNDSDNNDIYSNFDSSKLLDHLILIDNPSNLIFTLNIDGYIPKVQNYIYSEGIESLDIYLTPIPFISFGCTTIVKSDQDVQISQPIKGRDNYIEVTFTADSNISSSDYDVYPKAQLRGATKGSYIPMNYELFNLSSNSIMYRFEALDGDYNYISRIMNRICS